MTRTSPSATVIVAATGVLLFQVLMTSQGRRVGNPDIEDFNNRPAAAREVLVKLRSPLTGPRAAQMGAGVDADNVETGRPKGSAAYQVTFAQRSRARCRILQSPRCGICRAELHRAHLRRAERPAVSAFVGPEEHRPSRQRRSARDSRCRHQRGRRLGSHSRNSVERRRGRRHRHRLQPSRPCTQRLVGSCAVHGRHRRRAHHLRSRNPRVQRHQSAPAIRWTTTITERTCRERSARSATTAWALRA